MKKIIIVLPIMSLLLINCGNISQQQIKEQKQTASQEENHHHDESEAIELNNGQKWKVDSNMIRHIRNMENDVIFFTKLEQKYYKTLSVKLQTNIDLLTSNCTMKGQAHDELHKWLLPYIDLVQELSVAKDESEAAKRFEKIQTSYQTFNQYFQ